MFPGESIFPARSLSTPAVGTQQGQLYGDESLRLEWVSDGSAQHTLFLQARLWRKADNSVQLFERRIPLGESSPKRRDYRLDPGAIISLRIGLTTTALSTIALGAQFARLQLVYGEGDTATAFSTLLQGYISPKNDLGWPGSPLQTMHDGLGFVQGIGWTYDPINDHVEAIVPNNTRWRVMSGVVEITTSAVAGNRSVLLQAFDASGTLARWYGAAGILQAPSTTYFYSFGAGMPPTDINADVFPVLPWPQELDMTAGQVLRVKLGNAQAGDLMSGIDGTVRGWLEP